MLYFTKNEAGQLVLVEKPEGGQRYLNEKGEEIEYKAQAPAVHMDDPVMKLEGLISDLSNKFETQAKVEDMQRKLAAYEDAARRGFPVPIVQPGMSVAEADRVFAPFDLAVQGKQLQDKLRHPHYQIPEEKRVDVAKFMILFVKAAILNDPTAYAEFRNRYPRQNQTKTAIGDSGNTFPIPDIVDAEILAFARQKSTVLQYGRIWPMISDKQSFPAESSTVTLNWGNTTPSSDPSAYPEVELDCEELSAYSTVRNDTLADTRSDIVGWLTELMAEAVGQELDNVAFNGTGASNYAYCSGLLSAACGYSVSHGSGSTSFSSLTAGKLSEMIAKLDGMRKEGARFFMNGAVLHYVRTLTDTTGSPIFFAGSYGGPVPPTIFGYPYSEVLKMPATSGATTAYIVFGNLVNFCIGRRLDVSTLDVDPWGLWTTNRKRFKIYNRWALIIGLKYGFCRLLTA